MVRFWNESLVHNISKVLEYRFFRRWSSKIIKEVLCFTVIAVVFLAPLQASELEKIAPTSTTVTLYWTATGNNGQIGKAASYDIRYSRIPITEQNFDSANKAKSPPTPKQSGSAESFLVYGLEPNRNYYFAIKVADEFPNLSTISNVIFRTTASPPICGDINESGDVDITDLVHFVKFLFTDNTPIYNLEKVDLDSSGAVDISDLIFFIEYLFGNSNSISCP